MGVEEEILERRGVVLGEMWAAVKRLRTDDQVGHEGSI